MPSRLAFPIIALFWICMNVLLWRSEFGSMREFGSAIPVAAVWEKILTAPDDSALGIVQRGRSAGYCRWRPNVGQEMATGKVATDDYELDGRVERPSGYRIDGEGSLNLEGVSERIRFNFQGAFETNHLWRRIEARVTVGSNVWKIQADSGEERFRLRSEGAEHWEKELSFADIQNPAALLGELGFPMLPMFLSQLGVGDSASALSLGLEWEARQGWFKIGHSQIRVYRLHVKLLDRFQIVVIVSRIGEILRIELPNQILLVNDAFTGL